MSDASRLVILHNHLFKNAGTTIDWSLGRELGSAFVDHRDDAGMQQGARYLEGYLRDNPAMAALSTHHLTFPLPEIVGVRLAVLTMFRHPIERVTSVYAFERKQVTSRNPGPVKAREATLADYIEWRLEPLVGPCIRNFHFIKCLPPRALPLDPPDTSEFAQALAFARSVDLLGIVERFDERRLTRNRAFDRVGDGAFDAPQVPKAAAREDVGCLRRPWADGADARADDEEEGPRGNCAECIDTEDGVQALRIGVRRRFSVLQEVHVVREQGADAGIRQKRARDELG